MADLSMFPFLIWRRIHHDRLHRAYRVEFEIYSRLGSRVSSERRVKIGIDIECSLEKEGRSCQEDFQGKGFCFEDHGQEIQEVALSESVTIRKFVTTFSHSIFASLATGSCRNP